MSWVCLVWSRSTNTGLGCWRGHDSGPGCADAPMPRALPDRETGEARSPPIAKSRL